MQIIAQPEEILSSVFGYPAFRHHQEAIIQHLLEGKDAVVLMPTGGGKSLCYQIPALCLAGTTLVVSPLIALMKDQVNALQLNGIPAAFLNSSQSPAEQADTYQQLLQGKLKLLYVSPEKLVGEDGYLMQLLTQVQPALFAIDEAHCISSWGHDFRPEYRALNQLKKRFPNTPLIALTATADAITRKDMVAQLELQDYRLFEHSFNRPNIHYGVKPKAELDYALLTFLKQQEEESGIIYCLSRQSTETLANELCEAGFLAAAYHAGLEKNIRDERQEKFLKDEIRIIVATIAFGMGIHKSNVRFVVHADLPKNLEGYYQETGRAGRDGLPAEALLFFGTGDVMKLKRFAQIEDNPEQTAILVKKLNQMAQFCETSVCRRKFLLNYFGESAPAYCGNCDNCLHQRALKAYTIEAQKVLSTIYRLKESYGINYIIDILRASHNAKIKTAHQQLSVFGIGKDVPKQEWQYIMQQMLQGGYMDSTGTNYPVLQLNEKSKGVLFRGETVLLPAPLQESTVYEPTIYQSLPYEKELLASLKRIRSILAREENIPPYLIFSDSTLLDLCTYLPLTKDDISRMNGFGTYKTEKYGYAFLELIQAYCSRNQLQSQMHQLSGKKIKKPVTTTGMLRTKSDTKQLSLQLFREGLDITAIAESRQLSEATIEQHLCFFVEKGEISIEKLVSESNQELIRTMATKVGRLRLKLIKEALPDSISYAEIRYTLAAFSD
ncbi:MAG: DNA helicase RecQ [Sediminibacterium sp.]|nr:DNA helicase RecQ [Sediminibacterium sp.]